MMKNMICSTFTRNVIWTSHLLLATLSVIVNTARCFADSCTPTQVAAALPRSPLLAEVVKQISLPAWTWTVHGTHTAKGYTTEEAETTNIEGMKADCDNVNLNKKLAANFRNDVFGSGVKGFFYQCQMVQPDTNQYWFTISSADLAQIDQLCNITTKYPIIYDEQHNTYWIDEPFTCTGYDNPTGK